MKTVTKLQLGDKVYMRETIGSFPRFYVLTVVSVTDELAIMDNGISFARQCNKNNAFIEYSQTKYSNYRSWYICDNKILVEAKETNDVFESNKDLIKANILINSILCGSKVLSDVEKIGIYDLVVKTKNNDDYYNEFIKYNI